MDPSLSLNVHLAVPSNSHSESHTPNTPEILNSIVNMTNGPFANYTPSGDKPGLVSNVSSVVTSSGCNLPTPSPIGSGGEKSSSLSVQQYCSQFIKEGLKMKVKRKMGASKSSEVTAKVNNQQQQQQLNPPAPKKPKIQITPPQPPSMPTPDEAEKPIVPKQTRLEVKEELLSPDDLAKRLRRRERNKLAATKCRNKKKAQYTILAQEHEDMKRQNLSFKSESARLEVEKKKLQEVLEKHKALIPSCPLFLVKREESESVEREIDPSLGLRRSCSFSNNHQQQSPSEFFLGKSAITQSFYDLSSRCMAM